MSLILSESGSSLSLCLQKMGADRMRDGVKTEALATQCEMEPRNIGTSLREVVSLGENCNNGDEELLWFCEEGTMEKVVQVIPARKAGAGDGEQGAAGEREKRKLRVAAYCRVSTEQEEQLGSFANQVEYYTRLIEGEEDWAFAGIYADEGISGTGTRKRKGFQRLIEACDAGKVDFVITKSISRFARNTADCLVYARQLKDRGIPILFQKEGINTMEASGELLFTILSCFAQEESRSISENTKWGIRSKFQKGIPHVNTTRLFGFNKDADGQLCVDPEQGAVVRRIFRDYLMGFGEGEIARRMRQEGIPGITGTPRWSSTTVRRMLQNEKYQGDLLLQKYYTVSFLTGECARNEGALDQYFVMDAHEGIVSREEWEAVQQERARRLAYREEYQLKKLENTNPFFNRIRCEACGGMVVRGYGKAGRKPFWRCGAACRKHKGTGTRTTFPEQEVRRVMYAAWAQLVENRAVYETKWRETMESSETLALEKVRARQMLALMEITDGPGSGMAGMRNGLDGDAAGEKWGDHFSKAERMTEVPWRRDVWIRMVLEYMIAGERAYRVGFLDGSEVTVRVD